MNFEFPFFPIYFYHNLGLMKLIYSTLCKNFSLLQNLEREKIITFWICFILAFHYWNFIVTGSDLSLINSLDTKFIKNFWDKVKLFVVWYWYLDIYEFYTCAIVDIQLLVRASDCQCTSCNGPGFDPSIRRHSGIWGAAGWSSAEYCTNKLLTYVPNGWINCPAQLHARGVHHGGTLLHKLVDLVGIAGAGLKRSIVIGWILANRQLGRHMIGCWWLLNFDFNWYLPHSEQCPDPQKS